MASFSTARNREEEFASRSDKIAATQAILVDAVAAIQSGDDWRRHLVLQSRLHAYSANNVVLIAVQHARAFAEGRAPTAVPSYVAGYSTWRALGRAVEKGQDGYAILAPLRNAVRMAIDADGTTRRLGRGDRPSPGEQVESRAVLRGFRVEHVFAAEQTVGTELPTPPAPQLLKGEAPPGLRDAVVAVIEARGFGVSRVESAEAIGGANGRTAFDVRSVVVRADMDEAAQVKTLFHEAAHVLLHDPATSPLTLARSVREVEAESVAFVVASAHGMATDDYSFSYVASWAGEGGPDVVRASAGRIAAAARQLIEASPAAHGPGGRVPGVEAAVEASSAARLARSPGAPVSEPSSHAVARQGESIGA
jgi:hypothetical protein